MTAPRSRITDGHAVTNGRGRIRTPPDEQPTGAFDLLAAQIDALRQDIDYLKEQVALLQEIKLRERVPNDENKTRTHRESSI